MDNEYIATWLGRDRLRELERWCAMERLAYGARQARQERAAHGARALVAGALIRVGHQIARWGEGLRDVASRDGTTERTPVNR